ncbi:MAG: hypothetical protein WCB68_00685 [Pyrinomonadaceae bacterium]
MDEFEAVREIAITLNPYSRSHLFDSKAMCFQQLPRLAQPERLQVSSRRHPNFRFELVAQA